MVQLISTEGRVWRQAKKVQPIRAKAMINLLVDKTVANSFLINTLEGREPLGDGTIFCIGQAGDAWQQTQRALLKNYDVTAIDAEGWMVCTPKPENLREFFELESGDFVVADADYGVVGLWGETIGELKNVQRCAPGDFILRQREDHTDQWVVRRKLFLNTYTEINA